LAKDGEKLAPILAAESAQKCTDLPKLPEMDERTFRWALNEDAMATDKLADGIRRFAADARLLEHMIMEQL
jgi:transaldolase